MKEFEYQETYTKKLVDLSVVLNEQTPVYPGDSKITTRPAGTLEKGVCRLCSNIWKPQWYSR